MIGFALDVIKGVIVAVTTARVPDQRGRAIRVLIGLHDAILLVEQSSELLLNDFQAHVTSNGQAVHPDQLRRRVYTFATDAARFASEVRKVESALRVFDPALHDAFQHLGRSKTVIARSLLELTAPAICIDKSVPWEQRHYLLRVLDYSRFNGSSEAVRTRWRKDVLAREPEMDATHGQDAPTQFRSVAPRHYDLTREDQIANDFGSKYLSFGDFHELAIQLSDTYPRLGEMRAARVRLAEYLRKEFTMTDLF